MVGKLNQLRRRHVLVTGLVLGYGSLGFGSVSTITVPKYIGPEMPCLVELARIRSAADHRLAIGTNLAGINGLQSLVDTFTSTKSFDPNKKVILGSHIPLIHLAASLPNVASLQRIVDNDNAVVGIETAAGDTPLHAAAANSSEGVKLLIADGRLDVNEHNYNGETPLYIAMKYNNRAAADLIVASPRFRVNSRDNRGRTMLHIAVMFGEVEVIDRMVDWLGITQYGEDKQVLDVDVKDDMGRTPADYLVAVRDVDKKGEILKLLAGLKAKYGDDEPVLWPEIPSGTP
ncbi:MAG: ankyrin repeat domain-containing protein [Puniceicoccales bacterium]|jgi:hypothetical protein|nr:ankyrin repeat domain-containing protein [Puniceicoccales bacterium]